MAPAPPGLPMKTSLIVTTYNWPRALGRVLDSIAGQTRLPDEVIVADDGSGPDTAALLKARAARFPTALRHVWQEDQGFRAGRARNLAIAASRGDYLLLIDGDMVLHPDFVADHLAFATPGCFVQGSRVLTGPTTGARLLADPELRPSPWLPGLDRRRNALRLPWLARRLFARRPRPPRAIKTCNQGWWREDLLRLNGFDERMQGWGREDMELAWRAHHAGIHCRHLRFAALAWHLHHPERHVDGASANDRFLADTRRTGATRCTLGVDTHLAAMATNPPPDLRDPPAQPTLRRSA
ncbi:glycosyltransferase family 2 protein [Arenimonas fontis]|nr:glycosyltransferase family 2 protein [Arenimonas fontis]